MTLLDDFFAKKKGSTGSTVTPASSSSDATSTNSLDDFFAKKKKQKSIVDTPDTSNPSEPAQSVGTIAGPDTTKQAEKIHEQRKLSDEELRTKQMDLVMGAEQMGKMYIDTLGEEDRNLLIEGLKTKKMNRDIDYRQRETADKTLSTYFPETTPVMNAKDPNEPTFTRDQIIKDRETAKIPFMSKMTQQERNDYVNELVALGPDLDPRNPAHWEAIEDERFADQIKKDKEKRKQENQADDPMENIAIALEMGVQQVKGTSGAIREWIGGGMKEIGIDYGLQEEGRRERKRADARMQIESTKFNQEMAADDNNVLDSRFWTQKVPQSIPAMVALAPAGIAGMGVGGAVAVRAGLGTLGTFLTKAGFAGVSSRFAEGIMEGSETYATLIDAGLSHDDASDAAWKTTEANMALMFSDITQMAVTFAPINKIPGGRTLLGKGLLTTGKFIIDGASEGGEEVYQGYVQHYNTMKAQGGVPMGVFEYMQSDEARAAFTLGAATGLAFAGVGVAKDGYDNFTSRVKAQVEMVDTAVEKGDTDFIGKMQVLEQKGAISKRTIDATRELLSLKLGERGQTYNEWVKAGEQERAMRVQDTALKLKDLATKIDQERKTVAENPAKVQFKNAKDVDAYFTEKYGMSIERAKHTVAQISMRNYMRENGNPAGPVPTLEKESMPFNQEQIKLMQKYDKIKNPSSKYLFHTTRGENIESIRKSGLLTGQPKRYEDISAEGKLYFSANEEGAKYFGSDTDVMIRVAKKYQFKDIGIDYLGGGDGTYQTSDNIPPEYLEVKKNGKWVALTKTKEETVEAKKEDTKRNTTDTSGIENNIKDMVSKKDYKIVNYVRSGGNGKTKAEWRNYFNRIYGTNIGTKSTTQRAMEEMERVLGKWVQEKNDEDIERLKKETYEIETKKEDNRRYEEKKIEVAEEFIMKMEKMGATVWRNESQYVGSNSEYIDIRMGEKVLSVRISNHASTGSYAGYGNSYIDLITMRREEIEKLFTDFIEEYQTKDKEEKMGATEKQENSSEKKPATDEIMDKVDKMSIDEQLDLQAEYKFDRNKLTPEQIAMAEEVNRREEEVYKQILDDIKQEQDEEYRQTGQYNTISEDTSITHYDLEELAQKIAKVLNDPKIRFGLRRSKDAGMSTKTERYLKTSKEGTLEALTEEFTSLKNGIKEIVEYYSRTKKHPYTRQKLQELYDTLANGEYDFLEQSDIFQSTINPYLYEGKKPVPEKVGKPKGERAGGDSTSSTPDMKPDSEKRETTGTSKAGINNALKKVDEAVENENKKLQSDAWIYEIVGLKYGGTSLYEQRVDISEAYEEAIKLAPDGWTVQVEDTIIGENGKEVIAYADLEKKMIMINRTQVRRSTAAHEVVHAQLSEIGDSRRKQVIQESKKQWGKDLSDDKAEEFLAEEFKYYIEEKKYKTQNILGKIREFISTLANRIKGMVGRDNKIKTLYDDILQGKVQKMETSMGKKYQSAEEAKKRLSEEYDDIDAQNFGYKKKPVLGPEFEKGDVYKAPGKGWDSFKEFGEAAIVPIDSRVGAISQEIKDRLGKFEYDMRNNYIMQKSRPVLKALHDKLKPIKDTDDYRILDVALKNGNKEVIEYYEEKLGIVEEMKKVREILDNLHTDANDVGINVRYLAEYFPRMIGDSKGLLGHLYKTEWGSRIQEAIRLQEQEAKRELTDDEKAVIANKLMMGYRVSGIKLLDLGNAQERKIKVVTKELSGYYKDSFDSLTMYISGMSENIETRKFFGQVYSNEEKAKMKEIKKKTGTLEKYQEEIDYLEDKLRSANSKEYIKRQTREMKAQEVKIKNYLEGHTDKKKSQRIKDLEDKAKSGKITDKQKEELQELKDFMYSHFDKEKFTYMRDLQKKIWRNGKVLEDITKLEELREKRTDLKKWLESSENKEFYRQVEIAGRSDSLQDSVGAWTLRLIEQGKISPTQEADLSAAIRARFSENQMHQWLQNYKSIAYLTTMGSPISALSQIQDIGTSLYANGWWETGESFTKALFNKSRFKKADFGIDAMLFEFTEQGKLQMAVSKVFKWVGLEYMDSVGKETMINGAYRRIQKQVAKGDLSALRIFDGETQARVAAELGADLVSEEIRYMLFTELMRFQPLTRSQVPEYYNTQGNARIAYMLKTYLVKQIDVMRQEGINEAISEAKKGNAKKSALAAGRVMYLAMCLAIMGMGADALKNLLLNRPFDVSDMVVDNLFKLLGFSKYTVYQVKEGTLSDGMLSIILPPFNFFNDPVRDYYYFTEEKQKGGEATGEKLHEWDWTKLQSINNIPLGGKLFYWWYGKGEEKSEKRRKQIDGIAQDEPINFDNPFGGGDNPFKESNPFASDNPFK